MNNQFSISKALLAGINGTIVMTLFMFMGNLMGIQMNVPKMLASMFGGNLIIGWGMHFMIGIILAISYGFVLYDRISISKPWLRGAVFGIIPWLMAQVVVMPMMSMMNGMEFTGGLFSGSALMAIASLMAHLVFGVVVGFLYSPAKSAVPNVSHV